MAERTRCEICNREFKDSDGLAAHNKAKHPERVPKEKKPFLVKKIRNWSIFILIVLVVVLGIYFSITNIKTLPPISAQGHIEDSPPSHIIGEPILEAVQKHMLEHVDGAGRPGIIINYNCKDYKCEDDLIEKLEAFATKYDYVYVAPFKGMDAKIALIKLNKIEVLKEFNNETIEKFILY